MTDKASSRSMMDAEESAINPIQHTSGARILGSAFANVLKAKRGAYAESKHLRARLTNPTNVVFTRVAASYQYGFVTSSKILLSAA